MTLRVSQVPYVEQSYAMQAAGEAKMGLPSFFTAPDSIDCWRHTRMLASCKPLVDAMPQARWMTIGDGRYGSDAAYLHSIGANVVATSLTDEKLREGQARGFIDKFGIENAEALSCADGAFDFVLCKEAYHHLPRPPIALYEMLRAATTGVVLIEPYDNPKLLDAAKRGLKRLLRGDTEFNFEPSGNYLYRVNLKEMGQLMCAMGNHTIALRGINDFFHPKLSSARASGNNLAFLTTRAGVAVQDVCARSGLLGYGLCCMILFNGTPGAALQRALTAAGFDMIGLPQNPYLAAAPV